MEDNTQSQFRKSVASTRNLLVGLIGILLLTQYRYVSDVLLLNRLTLQLSEIWKPEYTFFDSCGSMEASGAFFADSAGMPKTHLQNIGLRVVQGRALWLTGRCPASADIWNSLLQEQVKHPASLAWLLSQMDTYEVLSPEEKVRLGRFAIRQGAWWQEHKDAQSAQIWYERAFRLYPSWETARVLVGFYSALTNQSEKIVEIWRSLLETRDQTTGDYWWARAEISRLSSDWLAAAEAFEQGALLVASPYEFYIRAGDSWYAGGNSDSAISAYSKASQALPGNGRSFLYIGDIEAGRGNYELALRWYEQALALNPDDPAILQVTGQTYFRLGNGQVAESYVERALAVSPSHSWTLFLSAQLNAEEGALSQAVNLARQALTAYPRSTKPTAWLDESLNWSLKLSSCQDAQGIVDFAQAGQVSAALLEQIQTLCVGR